MRRKKSNNQYTVYKAPFTFHGNSTPSGVDCGVTPPAGRLRRLAKLHPDVDVPACRNLISTETDLWRTEIFVAFPFFPVKQIKYVATRPLTGARAWHTHCSRNPTDRGPFYTACVAFYLLLFIKEQLICNMSQLLNVSVPALVKVDDEDDDNDNTVMCEGGEPATRLWAGQNCWQSESVGTIPQCQCGSSRTSFFSGYLSTGSCCYDVITV